MNEVHSVETEEKELRLKNEKETNQIIPSESEEALQLREAEVVKSVQKEKVENKLYKNANPKIESNELQDSGAEENDIGSESGKESNKLYLEPINRATELILENETELDNFLENTIIDSREVEIDNDNLLNPNGSLMKDDLVSEEKERVNDDVNIGNKKTKEAPTGQEEDVIHVIKDVEEMSGFKEQEIVI